MKKITVTVLVVTLITSLSYAQSKSFLTLKDKFAGERDVFSFGASGGLARLALRIAGERDWQEAISEVKNIRFIVIPKQAFRERNLSVSGFYKFVKSDGFESLAHIKERGQDVRIYVQERKKDDHRYLLLVNENNEFIAIEVKGYIDPEKIRKEIAYNN